MEIFTSTAGTAVAGFGALVVIALGTLGMEGRVLATASAPVTGQGTIVVSTSEELEAALLPSNAGQRIIVRAGTYEVSRALLVPDGVALVGEGVMTFDPSGRPDGFEPAGRTVLRSRAELVGDVLTLGHGALVQGLVIEDLQGRPGNAVVLSSRTAGDVVSATIVDCEIINPNASGISAQGPRGRGLVIITRNLNLMADPPPHDWAILSVEMTHSIIRAPDGGSGVFAINFASHSQITLILTGNVIGGGLDASGGVSRPNAVTASGVIVESERNLYRSDSVAPSPIGWNLVGGADAPAPGLVAEASSFNWLHVRSIDDRIEGFDRGVGVTAGRRHNGLSDSISWNYASLELHGTELQTMSADLQLFGARSLASGVAAGDGNVLEVLMRRASGSGQRANEYAHSWNESTTNLGAGNRLRCVGNLTAFTVTNDGISPAPAAAFFAPW